MFGNGLLTMLLWEDQEVVLSENAKERKRNGAIAVMDRHVIILFQQEGEIL
jgi:hypothetical protein